MTVEGGPVPVSRGVFDGLSAVRESGRTNMLDRHAVARIAAELSFAEAAEWARDNPNLYARAILRGMWVPQGSDGGIK